MCSVWLEEMDHIDGGAVSGPGARFIRDLDTCMSCLQGLQQGPEGWIEHEDAIKAVAEESGDV